MSEFLQRLEGEIQSRGLIPRCQAILLAVSGGLDSMALLHALQALSGKWRWKIVVAHFNHQLRGRSSDADERLVRRTAARLGLPFIAGRADVKRIAASSNFSLEMAGRKLRHEFFARVAAARKISMIALAHHADDQVELFFLRVLRGAGGEGLAGMKWSSPSPVNSRFKLVRPFLGFSKADLRGFARANRISFREDASNASGDFLRNRIRNELLPLIRGRYQPGLSKTVLRLMEIVGAEAETVGRLAEGWLRLRRPAFGKLSVAVQRRAVQSQLELLKVATDFDLVEQLRGSVGKCVSIDSCLFIARGADGGLKLREQPSAEFKVHQRVLHLAGRAGDAGFGGAVLNWRIETNRPAVRLQNKAGREWFDADKVGGKILVRHWRPGDRFQPIGLTAAVKLQDLFINAKIPRDGRRDLVLAQAADGEIFWVEGLRIAEHFKLTGATKRRLVWQWRRGKS